MIVLSKLEALGMFQILWLTFGNSPGYARVLTEIRKLLIESETWDTVTITAEKQDSGSHNF